MKFTLLSPVAQKRSADDRPGTGSSILLIRDGLVGSAFGHPVSGSVKACQAQHPADMPSTSLRKTAYSRFAFDKTVLARMAGQPTQERLMQQTSLSNGANFAVRRHKG
ncbi:MAG: hypothetical protein ORN49_09110, partial [Rhodobacteraceae bacterium]|nr:hypothetical protein [Paracoccaceae bacterium]